MWQDFPKKGVLFRDINPAMRNIQSFSFLSNRIFEEVKELEVDNVVAIESRGFIIGTMLAMKLNKGLIMIRKSGKLPGPIISKSYSVEYRRSYDGNTAGRHRSGGEDIDSRRSCSHWRYVFGCSRAS